MHRVSFGLAVAFVLVACGGGGEEAKAPQPAPVASALPAPEPVDAKPAEAPKAQPTLAELQQKTLAATWEALNAHDAKRLVAAYAEDAVVNVMGTPAEAKGHEAIATTYQRLFDAFSGFKVAPSRVFVKGDVVVVEWAWSGTHSGDLFGVKPTERKVGTMAVDVLWFSPEGRIARQHVYYDMGTVMAQVGASGRRSRPVPALPASHQVLTSSGGPEEPKNAELVAKLNGAFAKRSEADFLGAVADDVEWDEMTTADTSRGKEAAKKWFGVSMRAWTDPKSTPSNQWAVGDYVITESVFSGKHTGALGPIQPTKKDVALHDVQIVLVKDGKVQKGWSYGNGAEMMAQLGLTPMPGKGAPGKGEPGDTRPGKVAKPSAAQPSPEAGRK